MRFHCNCCGKDFTTLSQDKERKFAFSHLILDEMRCPHCGVSNKRSQPKPLRQGRSRWQPKHRSEDTSDYVNNIVLHPMCQSRLSGSLSGKITVICDGCPSSFNCLTGNVDDGNADIISLEEVLDKKKTYKAELVEEAKLKMSEKERDDAQQRLKEVREKLGKLGFGYELRNGIYCAKFRGTIWKLDDNDVKSIMEKTWHTQKTGVIKNTLAKRNVRLELAQELLKGVLQ